MPSSVCHLLPIFVALCLISLLIGSSEATLTQWHLASYDTWLILTSSRLPRLVTLILTGIGLSMCGVILQHITRNKFVEPATSGGLDAAKLGILVALTTAPTAGNLSRMVFALSFCFISYLIFITFIRRIQFKNMTLVPVIGLMYGGVLSAIAEFYAYRNNILQSMQGWLLGDFSKIIQGSYEIIYLILPIVIATYLYAHRFTVLGMGQDLATSLGLNYSATIALSLIMVAATVSTTVVIVGSVPFVGLVAPYLVSMCYGDNLKRTLPIVALVGASLLLLCDVLGRILIFPFEIPIGLTTGSLGGVLFLVLIFWRS